MNTNKMNNESFSKNTQKNFFNTESYSKKIFKVFNKKQNTLKVNPENYNNFRKIWIIIDDKLYEDKELKLFETKFDFKKFKMAKKQKLIWKEIKDLSSAKILLKINELKLDYEKLTTLWYLNTIWIDITPDNICNLNNLEMEHKKLFNIITKLQKYKLNTKSIMPSHIKELYDIRIDFDKLSKLKNLNLIQRGITRNDLKKLNNTEIDFDKLLKLKKLWVDLSNFTPYNLKELNNTEIDFDKLLKLKKLWVDLSNFTPYNFKELNDIEIDFDQLSKFKKLWVDLNKYHLKYFNLKECSYDWIKDIILRQDNNNIKNYYEWYNYHHEEIIAHQYYIKWIITEKIQNYVQEVISENRDIWETEIINKIKQEILILPKDEVINFLTIITKIVEKFNTIRKYVNFKNWPYKNPKDLLIEMRGIKNYKTIKNINNQIIVKQYWIWLMFFVHDRESYKIIFDWSLRNSKWSQNSEWFNLIYSKIPELTWTLSVIDCSTKYINHKVVHEWQHNRNIYFMPDKGIHDISNFARIKDEIIAYLTNWLWMEEIEDVLTSYKFKYNTGIFWIIHKRNVRQLCSYANDLIKLTKEPNAILNKNNVIGMLSYTPANKRKNLHSTITKAIKHNKSDQPWRTLKVTENINNSN